jgi:hypothetical protein
MGTRAWPQVFLGDFFRKKTATGWWFGTPFHIGLLV